MGNSVRRIPVHFTCCSLDHRRAMSLHLDTAGRENRLYRNILVAFGRQRWSLTLDSRTRSLRDRTVETVHAIQAFPRLKMDTG